MKSSQQILVYGALAIVALATTAMAASYLTRASIEDTKTSAPKQQARVVHHYQPTQNVAYQATKPTCNDHNIVGTVGGGVAGALVGNQFGGGSGKTLATLGGAAGGAYLGNEYIPTRGSTCN